jgi:hypothetical protein
MAKLTSACLHLIGNIDTINTKQTKSGKAYFEIIIVDNISEGEYPKKTMYKAFVWGRKETPDLCPYNVGDLIDMVALAPTTRNEKVNEKYETFIDLEFNARVNLIEKAPVVEEIQQNNHSSIASDDIPF